MEKDKTIKQCYNGCPFFTVDGHVMECGHPYWKDKGDYSELIITLDNSRDGKVPQECPLRIEPFTITYKLSSVHELK